MPTQLSHDADSTVACATRCRLKCRIDDPMPAQVSHADPTQLSHGGRTNPRPGGQLQLDAMTPATLTQSSTRRAGPERAASTADARAELRTESDA